MVGVVPALRWFLLGGVGDDDAAGGFFLGIDALDADAIVKWVELHAFLHVHHWILPQGDQRDRRAKNRIQDLHIKNLSPLASADNYLKKHKFWPPSRRVRDEDLGRIKTPPPPNIPRAACRRATPN